MDNVQDVTSQPLPFLFEQDVLRLKGKASLHQVANFINSIPVCMKIY